MLASQRHLFDIPRDVAYLNAAAWSPLPLAVQQAGREGVALKGHPWELDLALPGQRIERCRAGAACLAPESCLRPDAAHTPCTCPLTLPAATRASPPA